MTDLRRTSTVVTGKDVAIETYIDGQGPCLVVLPSYGRDEGEDYDNITGQLTANGWQEIRPQPRGIAGSTGPMDGQSLRVTLHVAFDPFASPLSCCLGMLSATCSLGW